MPSLVFWFLPLLPLWLLGGYIDPVESERPSIDQAPFMVQLVDQSRRFRCSGVLLDEKHVLTSAHCVQPSTTASTSRGTPRGGRGRGGDTDQLGIRTIIYGTERRYPNHRHGQKAYVEAVFTHPCYKPDDPRTDYNDIAVIRLSMAILLATTSAVPLTAISTSPCAQNQAVRYYGFSVGNASATVGVVGNALANSTTTTTVLTSDFMLTQSSRVINECVQEPLIKTHNQAGAVCEGDAGGALVTEDGQLIGLLSSKYTPQRPTSYSSGQECGNSRCQPGDVNVFVKVASHLPFIQRTKMDDYDRLSLGFR